MRNRLLVVVRALWKHERLGVAATTFLGSGWIMVTTPTNIPLGITCLGLGGFFGIWWIAKDPSVNITNKKLIFVLLAYAILITLLCRYGSWWLTLSPVSKTVALYDKNKGCWRGERFGLIHLSGNSPRLESLIKTNSNAVFDLNPAIGHMTPATSFEAIVTVRVPKTFEMFPTYGRWQPSDCELDRLCYTTRIANIRAGLAEPVEESLSFKAPKNDYLVTYLIDGADDKGRTINPKEFIVTVHID